MTDVYIEEIISSCSRSFKQQRKLASKCHLSFIVNLLIDKLRNNKRENKTQLIEN